MKHFCTVTMKTSKLQKKTFKTVSMEIKSKNNSAVKFTFCGL